MKNLYFLTGKPGVGKTSVVLEVINALQVGGYQIGGMTSKEKRGNGSRVGFEVHDIATCKKGRLAHVDQTEGPRVGKYRVDLEGLNSVGVKAVMEAIKKSDVVVIDEIGSMELYSATFKETVLKAIKCGKPVLCTIHYRSKDPLIQRIRDLKDTEIIEVTRENRDRLPEEVSKKILHLLQTPRNS